MGYIYMIKNKFNGKMYIGQTIRPIEHRIEEHRTGKSDDCRGIYSAIKKYGWKNFEKDWYECPDEDLNFDEELLVREMETLSPGGYNLREGGGNVGKLSDETKQKISEANTGKIRTDEVKQRMSIARLGEKNHNYGKTMSEETKKKISDAQSGDKGHWYGTNLSKETKQKIREALVGITRSEETKQKIRDSIKGDKNHMYGKTGEKNHKSKKVYQYDLDGNFVRSFGSSGEAATQLEKDGTNIRKCARDKDGRNKTAYGFKWSYVKY